MTKVILVALLALSACGSPDLNATCERHADFTDGYGDSHVMHTCPNGDIYYDGELYANIPKAIGTPSRIWHKKAA